RRVAGHREIHQRPHSAAHAPILGVRAQPRGPGNLVARFDRDRSTQRQPDRADAHVEGAPHAIAVSRDVVRPGDAPRRDRKIHEHGPYLRARRVDGHAMLELHATSRSARSVQTSAIARLYAALPRRSSIGSVAAAASAAASRIAASSSRRPASDRSASRARSGTGPAPPSAIRAWVTEAFASIATTAATEMVA